MTKFVRGLVSLDCWPRLLDYLYKLDSTRSYYHYLSTFRCFFRYKSYPMNFFETYPECSLPSTKIGHHARLRTFAPIATAHLSCARYTWRVPRHVFQARAPSRNSIKYRAGDLCGNLICEYFRWIIGDPHFFFGRSLSFLILSIILKNRKNLCVWSFNYFLYTIQIGSNWYMDTGVRELEVACF